MGLVRKTTKMKCYFHHTESRIHSVNLITVGVDLDHLDEVVFVRILCFKVTFFPAFSYWMEGSHYAQPTLRSEE